jgi:hypothetical protein
MRGPAQCLPLPFPAFARTAPKTYAAWPVWSDNGLDVLLWVGNAIGGLTTIHNV